MALILLSFLLVKALFIIAGSIEGTIDWGKFSDHSKLLALITGCLLQQFEEVSLIKPLSFKLYSDKEAEIKRKLRERGIKDAMKGCGFVPAV